MRDPCVSHALADLKRASGPEPDYHIAMAATGGRSSTASSSSRRAVVPAHWARTGGLAGRVALLRLG